MAAANAKGKTRTTQAHRARATASSPDILELPASDALVLVDHIKEGLPYDALARLQRQLDVPVEHLARAIHLSPRTLNRRKAQGRLSPEESDRLVRVAMTFQQAIALFDGDVAAARQWFTSPNRALGGRDPLNFAETDVGTREVEDLIGRLEHGVFT